MYIHPDEILAEVEEKRRSGELSKTITQAHFAYQASSQPGYIEQVDRRTGERRTGTFTNGHFIQLAQDT